MANGLALSKDRKFLAINEMGTERILRYWLRGTRAGIQDVLVNNIGGFNDNIRIDKVK